MKQIIISSGADGWCACLEDEPVKQGRGETPDAALGALVRAYPEVFGISIQRRY